MRPALVLIAAAAALVSATAGATTYKATLIEMADNPDLDRSRAERAYFGHPTGPASDGVGVALDETSFEMDARGTGVTLDTVEVDSLDAAKKAAQKAAADGAAAIVTQLPADWTLGVTDAVKLPVLNVGSADERLREADCRATLFHLLPSERMRADAIAQTLAAARWRDALLLVGPDPRDATRSAVVQATLKRYGLKVEEQRSYKLSADPRERDKANLKLLTKGDYDVVWVVDSDGEFARTLPYRTVLPRPVVGDGGLTALAWHAQFERFGAPQVSRRFARKAKRLMTDQDWAAWMAGKALAAAAIAAPNGGVPDFGKALATAELDGSKGVAMSFRPWDGQLRQPMLLTDGQGVVATAPAAGILHPRNVLDTLGGDQPEKLCKARGNAP